MMSWCAGASLVVLGLVNAVDATRLLRGAGYPVRDAALRAAPGRALA